jgi:hypothetical protein
MLFIGPLNKHEDIIFIIRGKYYGYPRCCTDYLLRRSKFREKYPHKYDEKNYQTKSKYWLTCNEHSKQLEEKKITWKKLYDGRVCSIPNDGFSDEYINTLKKEHGSLYKNVVKDLYLKRDYEQYVFESNELLAHYKMYPEKITEEKSIEHLEKIKKSSKIQEVIDELRAKGDLVFDKCCIEYTLNNLYYDKEAQRIFHKIVPFNIWAVGYISARLFNPKSIYYVYKCPECTDKCFSECYKKFNAYPHDDI